MKIRTVLWAALTAGVFLLAQGCTYQNDLWYFTQEETRGYEPEQPKETENESEASTGTEEEPEQIIEVSELYYAYHSLDDTQKKIYLEILDALANMKKDTPLSTVDKSSVDLVFACVMNDHPELFYVEGYQYTEYTLGSVTTGLTFSGTYSMGSEEAEQAKNAIEQKVAECFQQVPLNEDEYNTVKFLYEWLIGNTEYDKAAENNQNICSVFLQGRSVCQGYAKAMQYMLQKADIQCLLVTGFTNGERHGWNLVRVNGNYYYLDPTWGDASYASGNNADNLAEGAPSINYDYFLVTTDEITRTHSLEKVVELPLCLAVEDNYFVREGLYFESYDEGHLALVLGSDSAKSAGYVMLKCSSDSYDIMVQSLIDEQKIFDFIDRQGASVAYTSNETLRTICFWNLSDAIHTEIS